MQHITNIVFLLSIQFQFSYIFLCHPSWLNASHPSFTREKGSVNLHCPVVYLVSVVPMQATDTILYCMSKEWRAFCNLKEDAFDDCG